MPAGAGEDREPMTTALRIGTRRSALALWQAEHVKARLEAAHPGLSVELVHVVTTGDRIQDRPLATIGGKALFVKEIEERLVDGSVDLAVHSMKDVPAFLPDGLGLVATSTREDPADAFVARDPTATPTFDALPEGARIGTGSLRRTCQLKALRPDVEVVAIRGNVDTRLRKLDEDALHAVVLAAAGLRRLGLGTRITERIAPERCLPAVGQGALAIETRLDDARTREIVSILHDPDAAVCVEAERGFLSRLEGGCQVPIGAYAVLDGDAVHLRGLVGRPDGSEIV
jgi:hydroxymethylbilane synthase